MRDFTLEAYRQYLQAIKASYANIIRFADFFSANPLPDSFVIIRHDVDRKPGNALQMARLEKEMGICSTYYFRTKPHVFKPAIIREVAACGHEIGYHYESLADAKGDQESALKDFEQNLGRLRKVASVQTISMHGSPLSPVDNRDLWRNRKNHRLLKEKYGILGEVYLDIDYRNIVYINDTGRNWLSEKSNLRDRVASSFQVDFENGAALKNYLEQPIHTKMILLIHPERWNVLFTPYILSFSMDLMSNLAKNVLKPAIQK